MKKRWIKLQNNRDFQKIYDKGRFFVHPLLVIYLLRKPGSKDCRIGFASGKKIGNAVQRNRIRRQLREVVRLNSKFNCFSGYDIVVMLRKQALQVRYAQIAEAYAKCESKAINWLNQAS